jgi:hypothetical protein
MKKFTIEYKELIRENLEDIFSEKITEPYLSLKRGTIDLLDKSIDDVSNKNQVESFIKEYINNPEIGKLDEFVEDGDIFNFYLKYQSDIDDICNNNNWFDESPKSKNIFSLYSLILEGTRFGVIECMKELVN